MLFDGFRQFPGQSPTLHRLIVTVLRLPFVRGLTAQRITLAGGLRGPVRGAAGGEVRLQFHGLDLSQRRRGLIARGGGRLLRGVRVVDADHAVPDVGELAAQLRHMLVGAGGALPHADVLGLVDLVLLDQTAVVAPPGVHLRVMLAQGRGGGGDVDPGIFRRLFRAGDGAGQVLQPGAGGVQLCAGRSDLGGDLHGGGFPGAGGHPPLTHQGSVSSHRPQAGIRGHDFPGLGEIVGEYDVGQQPSDGPQHLVVDAHMIEQPRAPGRQARVQPPGLALGLGVHQDGAGSLGERRDVLAAQRAGQCGGMRPERSGQGAFQAGAGAQGLRQRLPLPAQ